MQALHEVTHYTDEQKLSRCTHFTPVPVYFWIAFALKMLKEAELLLLSLLVALFLPVQLVK
jgi:hypothetical protein